MVQVMARQLNLLGPLLWLRRLRRLWLLLLQPLPQGKESLLLWLQPRLQLPQLQKIQLEHRQKIKPMPTAAIVADPVLKLAVAVEAAAAAAAQEKKARTTAVAAPAAAIAAVQAAVAAAVTFAVMAAATAVMLVGAVSAVTVLAVAPAAVAAVSAAPAIAVAA